MTCSMLMSILASFWAGTTDGLVKRRETALTPGCLVVGWARFAYRGRFAPPTGPCSPFHTSGYEVAKERCCICAESACSSLADDGVARKEAFKPRSQQIVAAVGKGTLFACRGSVRIPHGGISHKHDGKLPEG